MKWVLSTIDKKTMRKPITVLPVHSVYAMKATLRLMRPYLLIWVIVIESLSN